MGEPQGAEDGLRGEGGEEADEDEAGEQDEGGGEHGGLEQGLTEHAYCNTSRRGEEGECKQVKAVTKIISMPSVEEAGDSSTNYEMDGEGDEGVDLEEGDNKCHCCRSPKHVWCKEQQGLQGGAKCWEDCLIIITILYKITFTAYLGNRRKTGEDSANLHKLGEC